MSPSGHPFIDETMLTSILAFENALPGLCLRNQAADVNIRICDFDGYEIELHRRVPFATNPRDAELINRYVAACVNNLVVTRGALSYVIITPPKLSHGIKRCVSDRYSHVDRLTSTLARLVNDLQSDRSQPSGFHSFSGSPTKPTGVAIGLNIGQSYIKGVIAGKMPTAVEGSSILSTLEGAGTRAEQICSSAERTIQRLISVAQHPPQAIGLCVGGMVFNGQILRGSGITLGLTESEYQNVRHLSQYLGRRFSLPVLLAQDAISKTYLYSALGYTRCIVLDIGTSLGGGYVSESGVIPAYLNQIGRVAFDLTDSALKRRDGEGIGLLSQYLSSVGLLHIAKSIDVNITAGLELEDSAKHSDEAVERIANVFRDRLIQAIMILRHYYEFDTVVVTGGVVAGRIGEAVFRSPITLGSSRSSINVLRADEPLYDACLGAAWAAMSEAATSPIEFN